MSVSKNQPAVPNPNLSGIETISYIPQAIVPAHQEGRCFYDDENKTLTFYNDISDTSLQIGQEMYIRVFNNTGVTITNGQGVYVSGADSGFPTISLARADTLLTSSFIGLATHNIGDGEYGYITTVGIVRGVNTSSYSPGDRLYLSFTVAGSYSTTIPSKLNYIVQVGIVLVAAAVGTILVQIVPSGIAEEPQAEIWVNGNGTATTINTVNVWEQVSQITQSGELLGWTHDGAGTLTAGATAAGKYTIQFFISSASAGTNKTYEIAISINDTIQTKIVSLRKYSTADLGSQSGGGIMTIPTGATVKLEVRNITDATDITIVNANISMNRLA